jgi:hypothetical protein
VEEWRRSKNKDTLTTENTKEGANARVARATHDGAQGRRLGGGAACQAKLGRRGARSTIEDAMKATNAGAAMNGIS